MFRDYRIYLNETKDPLPPREHVVDFDVQTNTKKLEKSLKLQGWTTHWLKRQGQQGSHIILGCFCEDGFCRPIRRFYSILTQVTIHPYAANHPGMDLMSLSLWESWRKGWMKMVWWKSTSDHGKHCWFYLKNYTKTMFHGMSIIGGCVCTTKNWTRSLAHSPSPYLAMMMQHRKFKHKQSILLQWIWKVGIGN